MYISYKKVDESSRQTSLIRKSPWDDTKEELLHGELFSTSSGISGIEFSFQL